MDVFYNEFSLDHVFFLQIIKIPPLPLIIFTPFINDYTMNTVSLTMNVVSLEMIVISLAMITVSLAMIMFSVTMNAVSFTMNAVSSTMNTLSLTMNTVSDTMIAIPRTMITVSPAYCQILYKSLQPAQTMIQGSFLLHCHNEHLFNV